MLAVVVAPCLRDLQPPRHIIPQPGKRDSHRGSSRTAGQSLCRRGLTGNFEEALVTTQRTLLLSLSIPLVALAVAFMAVPALANSMLPAKSYGYDISYPDTGYPGTSFQSYTLTFGIVGVTSGKAFTQNSKLHDEYVSLAGTNRQTPSLYMNLNYPVGTTAPNGMDGPYGKCAKGDKACQASNYGYNAASAAYSYAAGQGATASSWWLDIETANSWSGKTSLNYLVIQGAIYFFQHQTTPVAVGIYSSPSMWRSIAGSNTPNVPEWFAGPSGVAPANLPNYCTSTSSFTGGPVAVVQSYNSTFGHDLDYACQ